MKKVLWGLMLGVALLFSCHSSAPVRRDRGSPPLENAVRATVAFVENRIETAADQTAQVYCSGFFVSENTIVSALHCFQEMRLVRLGETVMQLPTRPNPSGVVVQFVRYGNINMLNQRFINDELNEATVAYIDQENDLAILELREGTRSSDYSLIMQVGTPEIGQNVFLVGHPLELVWSVVDGIISRNIINDRELYRIQASIPLIGGFSGGPLLLPNGRIIGIASSYVGNMHHLSLFIPARAIANGLFKYEMNRYHAPSRSSHH